MTIKEAIRTVLAAIDDTVVDMRRQPDSYRQGAFKRGWRAHEAGREYSDDVLAELTWDNLGYRLSAADVLPFATSEQDLDEVFEVAAAGYEDGSLRLDRSKVD